MKSRILILMGSIALSVFIQGHRFPTGESSGIYNRTDTGGRGQTIDPPAKKLDHDWAGCSFASNHSEKPEFHVCSFDTGGIRLPSDGKKHDYVDTGGGTLPGGMGKKFNVNLDLSDHHPQWVNAKGSA